MRRGRRLGIGLSPARRQYAAQASRSRVDHVPTPDPPSFTRKPAPQIAEHIGDPIPKRSPTGYIQPSIRTLRPEALSPDDHVSFPVDQEYCLLWDALAQTPSELSSSTPSAVENKRPYASFRYSGEGSHFPAGTQGFFYYYVPRGPAPPASGELRFRKTHSSHPTHFSSGSDLKAAYGLPWRIQLPTIAAFPQYEALCDILLRDRCVNEQTLLIAATMGKERAARREQLPIVHSFRQPFFLDFASPLHWWHFMGIDRLYVTRPMANILAPKVAGRRLPSPWQGSAICAFIPSQSPRHKNYRIMNVLILTLVEPPTPNPDFPADLREHLPEPPRAGDLIRRGTKPWLLDLDNCEDWRAEGFRVLFENMKLPSLRDGKLVGPPKTEGAR
ncbi:hypothetical protein BD414DRAFT_535304 [Trametes punicea]|nr:hypothetical protein BD414DRAFT_535304 [Trametes punicea]